MGQVSSTPCSSVPNHGVGPPLLQHHGWDDTWCFPLSSIIIPVHCTDCTEALALLDLALSFRLYWPVILWAMKWLDQDSSDNLTKLAEITGAELGEQKWLATPWDLYHSRSQQSTEGQPHPILSTLSTKVLARELKNLAIEYKNCHVHYQSSPLPAPAPFVVFALACRLSTGPGRGCSF